MKLCLKLSLNPPLKFLKPVVCIGNLTVGGAGKTPIAILCATEFQKRGFNIHFVTRGYKGSLKGPLKVINHLPHEVGDEALLLAQTASTWIAKKRASGVQAAFENEADIVILDDGHQNFSLIKDLSLIVIDVEYGFGNHQVFPAGPLREEIIHGLSRAQGLVFIHQELSKPDNIFSKTIKKISKGSLSIEKIMEALPQLHVQAELHLDDLEKLRKKNIIAFAGLGHPEKFFILLKKYEKEYDFKIIETVAFSDHHIYLQREIEILNLKAKQHQAILITTQKDKVKLTNHENILPIRLTHVIINGSWDLFFNYNKNFFSK